MQTEDIFFASAHLLIYKVILLEANTLSKTRIRENGRTTCKKDIYKGFGLDTEFTDGVKISTICTPMPKYEDLHNAYRYVCCDIGHANELIRMHLNKVKEISKIKTIDRSKDALSIEERIDRESIEYYQKQGDTYIYHAEDDTYTIPFGKAVQDIFKQIYYEWGVSFTSDLIRPSNRGFMALLS